MKVSPRLSPLLLSPCVFPRAEELPTVGSESDGKTTHRFPDEDGGKVAGKVSRDFPSAFPLPTDRNAATARVPRADPGRTAVERLPGRRTTDDRAGTEQRIRAARDRTTPHHPPPGGSRPGPGRGPSTPAGWQWLSYTCYNLAVYLRDYAKIEDSVPITHHRSRIPSDTRSQSPPSRLTSSIE